MVVLIIIFNFIMYDNEVNIQGVRLSTEVRKNKNKVFNIQYSQPINKEVNLQFSSFIYQDNIYLSLST